MHSRTTAREIVDDFAGEQLDYWVTGFGTGGTLKGVARVLAKERPETKIVVCEPADAPMLGSGDGAGSATRTARRPPAIRRSSRIRCRAGRPTSSRSSPAMRSTRGVIHRILPIAGADALRCSKELAQKEGIFVGITAGRDVRRRAAGLQPTRRRARPSSACCPTPASAISARRCSPTSRPT